VASLPELQAGFRQALLGGDERRIATEVVPDGPSASARIAVYRHHVLTSLTESLASTFPVVCRLVDRRFFGWLADCYIREHPPTAPCLFEYGADFPIFVARFPACATLPWLGDVACLEWAMNLAFHAPDMKPTGPERLAATRPEELGLLVVELDASVTYVESAWPIDAIWRANQPGAEPMGVDVASGPVRLEIRRRGDDVVSRALPASSFALRRALAEHAPLERALEAALAADVSFDLATEIRALLDEQLLAA
jgi:hypothetical protein